MRLTMAPYCAAIRPAACVPAMPSACTVCSASSSEPARGAGGGREHAERRAGMPALADMLLAHAACRRAGRSRSRRPRRRGIRGRSGRRGSRPPRSAPAARPRRTCSTPSRCTSSSSKPCTCVPLTSAALVEDSFWSVPQIEVVRVASSLPKRVLQDAAPFAAWRRRCAQPSESRIRSLSALAHLGRESARSGAGDELGDPAGVDVVGAGMFGHRAALDMERCERGGTRDVLGLRAKI